MQWKVGDFVIYRGKTYTFPGEVTAVDVDGQVMVKAFGDITGNYARMKHIFGPDQLKPFEFGNGTGSPFLVIDPERDLIAQVRAFCELHPEKSPLGLAQLHAFLAMVDEGERQKPPQVFHDATPFLVSNCQHKWIVDGLSEEAVCEYCGKVKQI